FEAHVEKAVAVREVRVGPLGDEDAVALARSLLGPDRAASAASVARESGGSPFFVQQLAHRTQGGAPEAALADVLRERIDALPAPARSVLAAVALAARPTPIAGPRDAGGREPE